MNINFAGHLQTFNQLDRETVSKTLKNKRDLEGFNKNLGAVNELVTIQLPHEDTVCFKLERDDNHQPIVKIKVDVPDECYGRHANLRQYAGKMVQTFSLQEFARFGRAQITDVGNTIIGTIDRIKEFTNKADIAKAQCDEIREMFSKVDNDGVLKEYQVLSKDFMRTFNDRQFNQVKTNLMTLERQLQRSVEDSEYKTKMTLKHHESAAATLSIELIVPELTKAECPKAERIALAHKQTIPMKKLAEFSQTNTQYMVDRLSTAMEEIGKEQDARVKRNKALTAIMKMPSAASRTVSRTFKVNAATLTRKMPNEEVINLEQNLTALTDKLQTATLPGDRVVIELDQDEHQQPVVKAYISIPDVHESTVRGMKVIASNASGESYLKPFLKADATQTINRLSTPIEKALGRIHSKVNGSPELLLERTFEFLTNQ